MHKLLIIFLVLPLLAQAQELSIRNNITERWLVDRYSILLNNVEQPYNTAHKNIDGKQFTTWLIENQNKVTSNYVDKHNIATMLLKHKEWNPNAIDVSYNKGVRKYIYKNPVNFFESKSQDYFVSINPIIYYQQCKEGGNSDNTFINTRGAELKAVIKNKVSAYFNLTDNQERDAMYVRDYISNRQAVPSAGYIKPFKTTGMDYTNASGFISFSILPKHMNLTFGHDRHFIGDGYRSLFLCDFGPNNLFLKLDTRFWKIHYRNLFMELTPTRTLGLDKLLPKKFAAMHHLSINVLPKWQLGFFEGVMFARKDQYDLQYLNPVIFYRTVEQQLGSPDNALLGFDTKVQPHKQVQVYSQFLLDEFNFGQLRKNNNWWASKYAWQIGAKYINVANIKNLDLQIERNYIRPFTYTYKDSVADYSNYNQPLAHPNGANLIENIAIVRYQPFVKLFLSAEFINKKQGLDTSALFSNGGDVLKDYNLRGGQEYGFKTLGGVVQAVNYLNLNASYELWPNLYLDAGYTYRNATSAVATFTNKSNMLYIAFRLNANRRVFNF